MAKELSLRPYTGTVIFTRSKAEYEKLHGEVFSIPDIIQCDCGGRMAGGGDKDGMWTYLVYANKPHYLAHEMTHVVLAVFERCGIDPIASGGEPFCYMLSQLIMDANHGR